MYAKALSTVLVFGATVSAGVVGRTYNSTTSTPASTPTSPCAIASMASASYVAAHPTADSASIKPSIAIECLKSVPVDAENDVGLIDYLIPFVNLQSTLALLASPPEGYLLPAIDVLGGLKEIRSNLFNNYYSNQWEFALDLNAIYSRASDGHFDFRPSLLYTFGFQTDMPLISVSTDGVAPPQLFIASDFVNSVVQNYAASPVVTIDGVPAGPTLEILSQAGQNQDPDALYNLLFHSTAGAASGLANYFSNGAYTSIEDTTILGFANGSTFTIHNVASMALDTLDGITSGELLHQAVELPVTAKATATSSAATETATATSTTTARTPDPTAPGYPYPVVKHVDNYVAGYFLNDTANLDTAVLAAYSFEHSTDIVTDKMDLVEFRRVLTTFFDACRAQNKTKLVIDLSANGGGLIANGYEMYKQLFPSSIPYDGVRLRATSVLNFIGNATFESPDGSLISGSVDENEEAFSSWDDVIGPQIFHDDLFTNIIRYNFSDPAAFDNYTITGYGDQVARPQPFAAENIIIITNGVCASTCTIFTGLMARQEGVRTIALGGRPIEKPMQAMGGVKGAQVLPWSVIEEELEAVLEANGGMIPYGLPIPPKATAPINLITPHLNFKNAYLENDTSGTPVHFIYEAANCKRFYRAEYHMDITVAWTDAAEVAWGGGLCVDGSTARSDGMITGGALPYSADVRPKVPFAAVPGSPGTA